MDSLLTELVRNCRVPTIRKIVDSPLGFVFTDTCLLSIFMVDDTIYEARININLTQEKRLALLDFTIHQAWADEGDVMVVENGNALYFELEEITIPIWEMI